MLHTLPRESVTISNGIKVTVPSSLHLMTPYILVEQQDWFEDEIHFIRSLIQPGDTVIDIGANYGLYTLSMAVKAGESGRVWAFEPTAYVADCLTESIAENNLHTIELIQAGMSDHCGTTQFFTSPNAELNSLHPDKNAEGSIETIELVTLDSCFEKYGWHDIAFIKLDAEGEEENIISGGSKFLAAVSPLIMFELKHGDTLNVSLINKFSACGYACYYLLPGLQVLVPFDKGRPFDGFQLNLFCCKEDKAEELKNRGLLIKTPCDDLPRPDDKNTGKTRWHDYMATKPFAQPFFNEWRAMDDAGEETDWKKYQQALDWYTCAKTAGISPEERLRYLTGAYMVLDELTTSHPTFPRLMSLTRCAAELGKRTRAVEILAQLINNFGASIHALTGEPFVPVSQRYDSIHPGDRQKEWVISSILEQYEILHAFSSYYTGKHSLPILEKLKSLGFQSNEMKRRLQLIQKRFNITSTDE